jgi:two-component system sensor histidine kinase BaeS
VGHAPGAAVVVRVAATAADVVIEVADDGPGISADELPHLFDRYRQGRRHLGGAGLGLAIVRGLAEAHGGTASVTSVAGHGARFTLTLPREAAAA